MDVVEAVAKRRSVRAFLDEPVPQDVIRRLIASAARSPSGGNLPPWSLDVVSSDRLADLKTLMRERVAEAAQDERLDVAIYPDPLCQPYHARRREIGEALYETLGIDRLDKASRRAWFLSNFQLFGAPMAIFVHVDRTMGAPQWADLGMFVQTLLLLCTEAGLGTCAQECWALYPQTVGRFLATPANLLLFCGIAVGFEDSSHATTGLSSMRAPIEDFVRFHGD